MEEINIATADFRSCNNSGKQDNWKRARIKIYPDHELKKWMLSLKPNASSTDVTHALTNVISKLTVNQKRIFLEFKDYKRIAFNNIPTAAFGQKLQLIKDGATSVSKFFNHVPMTLQQNSSETEGDSQPDSQPDSPVFTGVKKICLPPDSEDDFLPEIEKKSAEKKQQSTRKFKMNAEAKSSNILSPMNPSSFFGNTSQTHMSQSEPKHRTYGQAGLHTSIKRRPGYLPSPGSKRARMMPFRYSWSQLADNRTPLHGFSNLGNTCYMNAILQCLFGLSTFSSDLITISKEIHSKYKSKLNKSADNNILLFSLGRLGAQKKKNALSGETARTLLTNIKHAISSSAKRFSGNDQQDAHEFLGQVLDQLKEEVIKVNKIERRNKKRLMEELLEEEEEEKENKEEEENNPISEAYLNPTVINFDFTVQHTIRCLVCEEMMTKEECFHDLSLNMPGRRHKDAPVPSIQDALDLFFQNEKLEYKCEQCGATESEISHKFTKLPRVLVLHLKRYSYDVMTSYQGKVARNIYLPRFLTLRNHCTMETSPAYPLCVRQHSSHDTSDSQIFIPDKEPPPPTGSNTPRRKLEFVKRLTRFRAWKSENQSYNTGKVRRPLMADDSILTLPSKAEKLKTEQRIVEESMQEGMKLEERKRLREKQEQKDLQQAMEDSKQENIPPKTPVAARQGNIAKEDYVIDDMTEEDMLEKAIQESLGQSETTPAKKVENEDIITGTKSAGTVNPRFDDSDEDSADEVLMKNQLQLDGCCDDPDEESESGCGCCESCSRQREHISCNGYAHSGSRYKDTYFCDTNRSMITHRDHAGCHLCEKCTLYRIKAISQLDGCTDLPKKCPSKHDNSDEDDQVDENGNHANDNDPYNLMNTESSSEDDSSRRLKAGTQINVRDLPRNFMVANATKNKQKRSWTKTSLDAGGRHGKTVAQTATLKGTGRKLIRNSPVMVKPEPGLYDDDVMEICSNSDEEECSKIVVNGNALANEKKVCLSKNNILSTPTTKTDTRKVCSSEKKATPQGKVLRHVNTPKTEPSRTSGISKYFNKATPKFQLSSDENTRSNTLEHCRTPDQEGPSSKAAPRRVPNINSNISNCVKTPTMSVSSPSGFVPSYGSTPRERQEPPAIANHPPVPTVVISDDNGSQTEDIDTTPRRQKSTYTVITGNKRRVSAAAGSDKQEQGDDQEFPGLRNMSRRRVFSDASQDVSTEERTGGNLLDGLNQVDKENPITPSKSSLSKGLKERALERLDKSAEKSQNRQDISDAAEETIIRLPPKYSRVERSADMVEEEEHSPIAFPLEDEKENSSPIPSGKNFKPQLTDPSEWNLDEPDDDLQRAIRNSKKDLENGQEKSLAEREEELFQQALDASLKDTIGGVGYTEDSINIEEMLPILERSDKEKGELDRHAKMGDLEYCYQLMSVVCHLGAMSSAGHYVSDVYDPIKDKWLTYDDSAVMPTSWRDVSSGRQKTGYIYFYMAKEIVKDITEEHAAYAPKPDCRPPRPYSR